MFSCSSNAYVGHLLFGAHISQLNVALLAFTTYLTLGFLWSYNVLFAGQISHEYIENYEILFFRVGCPVQHVCMMKMEVDKCNFNFFLVSGDHLAEYLVH